MTIALIIILVIIAITLFVSVQKGWITDKILQRLANIAGIVALLAAMAVFIVPAPTPSKATPKPPTSEPEPLPTNIVTTEPTSTSSSNSRIVGTVKQDMSLGVRIGPGFEYELLTTLSPKQTGVDITAIALDESREWMYVRLPNSTTEGWVLVNTTSIEWGDNANMLPMIPFPLVIGVVAEEGSLPIRSGPSAQFELVTTLPAKERLIAIAQNPSGDWVFLLLPDGATGWVLRQSKFIEWNGDLNSLPDKSP